LPAGVVALCNAAELSRERSGRGFADAEDGDAQIPLGFQAWMSVDAGLDQHFGGLDHLVQNLYIRFFDRAYLMPGNAVVQTDLVLDL